MTSTLRRRRPSRRIVLKSILLGLSLAFLIWAAGFYRFAQSIPTPGPRPDRATEAIVVLTGGAGRVREGLRLLEDGVGRKLFVSGVYRGVDVQALLRVARRAPGELECCIVLGYAADSTRGNARETAAWLAGEQYRSVRLVTASYHMPRSLFEFSRYLPGDVVIVPHPVFPERFADADWWRWRRAARLAISEYHKYLIARLEALT